MFQGAIPPDMQKITAGIIGDWSCEGIYVGCSGNFTIQRCLADSGHALYGNDVTLYSCAIGHYLAGDPLDLNVSPQWETEFGWLAPYLEDPTDTLATLLLASNLVMGLGRSNAYYDRMREAYRDQWDRMHSQTRNRVESVRLKLAGFHAGDVVEWMESVPQTGGVVCYPPFMVGGYEKMFENLEALFDWEPPVYDLMGEDEINHLFEVMTRKRNWMIGVPHLLGEEWKDSLRGMAVTTNRGVPLYLYANAGKRAIALPKQKIEPVRVERLIPGQELGDEMQLTKLTPNQFGSLRSQYMSPAIPPAAPSDAYGVLVDKKLIGAFAISDAPTLGNWDSYLPGPTIYLMSDFPVAPTDYPRMSKLVLYATQTQEAKMLMERSSGRRLRSIATTAFTKQPVSMKYRGVYQFLNRSELEEGEVSGARHKVNYGTLLGQYTLDEALAAWKKKHGTTSNGKGA